MGNPQFTNIPVYSQLNKQASNALKDSNITTGEAIQLFLEMIAEEGQLPKTVTQRNELNRQGVQEIMQLIPLGKQINTKEELREWLDGD